MSLGPLKSYIAPFGNDSPVVATFNFGRMSFHDMFIASRKTARRAFAGAAKCRGVSPRLACR